MKISICGLCTDVHIHRCSSETCSKSPLRHNWFSCKYHIRFNSRREMFHKLNEKNSFPSASTHLLIKLLSIGWLYFQGHRTSSRANRECYHPPKKDNYNMYTFITRKMLNPLREKCIFIFLAWSHVNTCKHVSEIILKIVIFQEMIIIFHEIQVF